jgi:hypothetical protein
MKENYKMKTKIFLLLITFLLISFVAAQSFCVDFDEPSAPTNLVLTKSGSNIQLNWDAAIDVPDCSGISHYDIYRGIDGRNLELIKDHLENTNYSDENLEYGTYTYIIHAWDLAGHNEGNGISNSIILKGSDSSSNGGSSGGGGGGSSAYWQCGEWGKCIEGISTRICSRTTNPSITKKETKTFLPEFTELDYQEGNQSEPEETQEETTTGFLTGAVTGVTNFVKSGLGLVIGAVILIAGFIAIFITRKKKSNS